MSRTGYTSELGYEIYLYDATANGNTLWKTVLEAGAPHDLRVIGPCHIRRIEGGILAFGCDIWYDTNPFEVDMGYTWMVDLDQDADFIGKQALRRIKAEGPRRKLVGVEIDGPSLGSFIDNQMIDTFPVFDGGHRIGSVTSACHSPRLEKNIGFAMLPIEHAHMGNRFEVETPHGRQEALRCRSRSSIRRRKSPSGETVGYPVASGAACQPVISATSIATVAGPGGDRTYCGYLVVRAASARADSFASSTIRLVLRGPTRAAPSSRRSRRPRARRVGSPRCYGVVGARSSASACDRPPSRRRAARRGRRSRTRWARRAVARRGERSRAERHGQSGASRAPRPAPRRGGPRQPS